MEQVAKARSVYQGLPRRAQVAILAAAAVTAVVLFIVVRASTSTEWTLLQSQVPQDKMPAITQVLEDEGIAFKTEAASGKVFVEASQGEAAQLALANAQLLTAGKGNHDTYDEILGDNGSLTETQAEKKIRQKQLIEGQVANQIEEIEGIESANVVVTQPDEKLFEEDEIKPTMSITVNTGGNGLEREQSAAITQLAAYAVPGMTAENVTITDEQGNIVGGGSGEGRYLDTDALKLEIERRYNIQEQARIEAEYGPLVGADNINVVVNAKINMDKVKEELKEYGGEDREQGLVAREDIHTEELDTIGATSGGVVGTTPNITDPTYQATDPGTPAESAYTKEDETVFYSNDELARITEVATGDIDSMGIAVALDESVSTGQFDMIENGFAALYSGPGVKIDITEANFNRNDTDSRKLAENAEKRQKWMLWGKFALIGLGLLGLAFFVRRTLLARQRELMAPPAELMLLERGTEPIRLEELEAVVSLNAGVDQRKRVELQRKVAEVAAQKPADVALLLRGWMHDEEQQRMAR